MKTWNIPITYSVSGMVKIEAETLEDAMRIAKDEDEQIPLPDDADYIDGSWELSFDMDEIDIVRDLYND